METPNGYQNSKSDEGGGATSPTSAAISGASEIVKQRRGRPKGSGGGASSGAENASSANSGLASKQAELQAQFERLYDPAVWEGLVAAPANIALSYTGNKIWDLPKDEVKALSIQASVTARCFAVADPKWLALTMLSISIVTIYGGRMMQYYSEKAEKELALKNKPMT